MSRLSWNGGATWSSSRASWSRAAKWVSPCRRRPLTQTSLSLAHGRNWAAARKRLHISRGWMKYKNHTFPCWPAAVQMRIKPNRHVPNTLGRVDQGNADAVAVLNDCIFDICHGAGETAAELAAELLASTQAIWTPRRHAKCRDRMSTRAWKSDWNLILTWLSAGAARKAFVWLQKKDKAPNFRCLNSARSDPAQNCPFFPVPLALSSNSTYGSTLSISTSHFWLQTLPSFLD